LGRCSPATPDRGSTQTAQTAETAAAALRNSISVDVHSHGGSTGITSKAPPSGDSSNARPLLKILA
jgi:membrane dipeptidase